MFSPAKTLSLLALASSAMASPAKFDWSKIDYFFQFGDSYTTVGNTATAKGQIFDFFTPQLTTAAGPMYGTVLAVNGSTNPSGTQQIDYAVGGASVNNTIVNRPDGGDFVTQANLWTQDFIPAPSNVSWNAENSLFSFFFGINDVAATFQRDGNQTAIHEEILDSYIKNLEILYENGSKNWLFLNVVPFDKIKYGEFLSPEDQKKLGPAILDYNQVLDARLKAFCATKADVNCFHFDTYSLFDELIQNYQNYGFVSGIDYCDAYQLLNSTEPSYVQTEPCSPLPTYLWLNFLHPTWPAHKIMAEKIADLLKQG